MSTFANANIPEVVEQLTTEEAILLTAGVGFWHTHAVPRLGIPAIKVTDGPNGARGNYFFMSTPAKCLPCSTAMGATFDTALMERIGHELLAAEVKLKAASVLLGPTCNIQRNPLGGRSFESFSEDPFLSGMVCAAYCKGLQAGGIGACIKHFTGNDKENDRFAYNSIISPRALREIYLMPFMLAEKYAQPWAYMTAYNRVNGTHVSENPFLIRDVLRKEWGSDALVMSDWTGVFSVDHALNAGLDLEMPGTNKWRTLDLVNRTINSRKTTVRIVKERAAKVLELVQKCAKGAPEVLDGDKEEQMGDRQSGREIMTDLATKSIVLLKNEGGLLPLKPKEQGLKKIAIVGGNAKAAILSGGGSAALKPSFFVSPYDGLVSAFGKVDKDVEITYCEGATTYMQMPTLEDELMTEDGRPGWMAYFYRHENDDSMVPLKEPHAEKYVDETRLLLSVDIPSGLTTRYTLRAQGKMKPRDKDTEFKFGLCCAGRARLFVDGKLIIDNWTHQTRAGTFFGTGSTEKYGIVTLKAGVAHDVLMEFANVRAPADDDPVEALIDVFAAVRLGGAEISDEDALMDEAVRLAAEADAVIAVVGLNADWETEGYDRETLALPRRTDELVRRVAAANKRTVVVTQSGSSITMPWADEVPAIVHAWYLGNATGDAIGRVITGEVNPSGRLSLTFPKRLEDVPSHGHFHHEHGTVWYGEDLFVGYKHFHHRAIEPQWHFGHGLSYTTFEFSDLAVSEPKIVNGDVSLSATVKVTNTGKVAGTEVVQLYVSMPTTSELTHPPLTLKAFAKTTLAPGASETVTLTLDKYAVSFWEERIKAWVVEPGVYRVRVGRSSAPEALTLAAEFKVAKRFEWNGL